MFPGDRPASDRQTEREREFDRNGKTHTKPRHTVSGTVPTYLAAYISLPPPPQPRPKQCYVKNGTKNNDGKSNITNNKFDKLTAQTGVNSIARRKGISDTDAQGIDVSVARTLDLGYRGFGHSARATGLWDGLPNILRPCPGGGGTTLSPPAQSKTHYSPIPHTISRLMNRVVTCDVIDSSDLHSVRSPSRPWQGASSVPSAGERRC